MKKITILLSLFLFTSAVQLLAQAPKEMLKSWKKVSNSEMMDIQDSALGELPTYDLDGKLLKAKTVDEMMDSMDYIPQYYKNDEGAIVAIQLIKMPAEQRKMIEEFMASQKALEALIGTDAKNFKTTDMDGNAINLSDLKGSVVAINFWFIGCKPCIMEMPELNEIVEKFEGEKVEFIAVALDSKGSLRAFEEKREFNYNIVPDGRSVAHLYGIQGYPTHCIIDQEGKIQYFKSAYSPRTASELESTITRLLKN